MPFSFTRNPSMEVCTSPRPKSPKKTIRKSLGPNSVLMNCDKENAPVQKRSKSKGRKSRGKEDCAPTQKPLLTRKTIELRSAPEDCLPSMLDEPTTPTKQPLGVCIAMNGGEEDRMMSGFGRMSISSPSHEDYCRPSTILCTPTVSPRPTMTPVKGTPSRLFADPVAAPFDAEQQLRWVGTVTESLKKMLPADIEEFHDDNAGVAPAPTVSDDDVEEGPVKINVDLYKKLFLAFRGFKVERDQNGMLVVATAFDTLLKIRLNRIHNSLLKTYYTPLVEVLSVKYPAIVDHLNARKWIKIPGIEFSKDFVDTAAQWMKIQGLQDVLVAPCDNTTYAGVIKYGTRLAESTANYALRERVMDSICSRIQQLESDANEQNPVVCQTVENLWRLLEEIFDVCIAELNADAQLVNIVDRTKMLGRICRGMCIHSTKTVQRLAATVFHKLAQNVAVREHFVGLLREFPQAFAYLIPPLYDGDRAVQTESGAALNELFEKHRRVMYPLIYSLTKEHFALGIEEATDPAGLTRILMALVVGNYAKLEGNDYFEFHNHIFHVAFERLKKLEQTGNPRFHSKTMIPLMQYLGHLLVVNPELFCQEFSKAKVHVYLHNRLEKGSRAMNKQGALWGATHELLRCFVKELEAQ